MKPPFFFSLAVITLFVIIVLLPILYMITAPFVEQVSENLNYNGSLFDNRHITLAENSLALALGTTAFCLVIGVPLAFLIFRTNLWGRGVFKILYIIPILIPSYIHS